ncbi:MAG: class I SAM-dependent RNA methyltransferase [Sciscionella sp.]
MMVTAPESSETVDWTGRRCAAEVGAVAHGGHCVARVDGRVVFVRHALPGERVVIEITSDGGGSFCRGDAVEILTPSPDRVEPACPVSGPGGCGGCDWQHADPAAQRGVKAAVVAEQLRRLAGVQWPVEVAELPGGPLRWRRRARLAVDKQGRPGFRANHSHRVIPVQDCPITSSRALDGVLGRKFTPGGEVEVAEDGEGTAHLAELVPRRSGRRGAPVPLRGDGVAVYRAAGRSWRVSAHGFWQVHRAAADVLAATVAEFADAQPGGAAWDLYGGVGLFGSVLAEQVGTDGSVLVVESTKQAMADGEANLADLPQVRFARARVDKLLAGRVRPAHPDVVVLDPPRSGAGRAVVDGIATAQPTRVVYVACDPAALARDVALLQARDYQLTMLRAYDAFPMTHHVECVALLEL